MSTCLLGVAIDRKVRIKRKNRDNVLDLTATQVLKQVANLQNLKEILAKIGRKDRKQAIRLLLKQTKLPSLVN